jgi:hypothetical protein
MTFLGAAGANSPSAASCSPFPGRLVSLIADEREDVGLTTSGTGYFDFWQPLHFRVGRLDDNPHLVFKATVATGVVL